MNMGNNKNPHSLLHALIKKQEWNLNLLSGETNCAINAVKRLKSSVNDLESDIERKTKSLQLQQAAGQLLEPDNMERIKKYIEYKSTSLDQKITEKNKAEKIAQQLTEEYEQQNNKLQVMLEMLEKRESELHMSQVREFMLEMDDLWVQREFAS
jgi:DNA polymerase II small subunit/DNA polymerase delta subunit B